MSSKAKKKFGLGSLFIIIFILIVAELLSLIPGISVVVSIVYWIIFGVIAYYHGYGIVNGRKLVTGVLSMVIEWIPAISILPSLTVGTIIMLSVLKAERVTGISLRGKNGELSKDGLRNAVTQNIPLYNDGVRNPSKAPPIYNNNQN